MGKTTATIHRNDSLAGLAQGSDYLSEVFSKKLRNGINSSDFGVFQGSIILRALSIELSLKCLIDEAGETYEQTHDATKLFDQLADGTKSSIIRDYESVAVDKSDWPELDELLTEVSHIFVEWRYATLESNQLNIKLDSWVAFGNVLIDKLPKTNKSESTG